MSSTANQQIVLVTPFLLISSRSPQSVDSVGVKRPVNGDDRKVARQRLGYEHSIKGITVVSGQPTSAFSIRDTDRQFPEALAAYAADNISRNTLASR